MSKSRRALQVTPSAQTEAERRIAHEQALASSRLAGHVPTPEFLADCEAVIAGTMTLDELRERSRKRADAAERNAPRNRRKPSTRPNVGAQAPIPTLIRAPMSYATKRDTDS